MEQKKCYVDDGQFVFAGVIVGTLDDVVPNWKQTPFADEVKGDDVYVQLHVGTPFVGTIGETVFEENKESLERFGFTTDTIVHMNQLMTLEWVTDMIREHQEKDFGPRAYEITLTDDLDDNIEL